MANDPTYTGPGSRQHITNVLLRYFEGVEASEIDEQSRDDTQDEVSLHTQAGEVGITVPEDIGDDELSVFLRGVARGFNLCRQRRQE